SARGGAPMNGEEAADVLLTPETPCASANQKSRGGGDKKKLIAMLPRARRIAKGRRDLTVKERRENAIDRVLLEPLEKRFADFNLDYVDALFARGLLPPETASALCLAGIHARYLAHVKLANRLYKVPVSLLLAECWCADRRLSVNNVPDFG